MRHLRVPISASRGRQRAPHTSSNKMDLQQLREQPCWVKGSMGLLMKLPNSHWTRVRLTAAQAYKLQQPGNKISCCSSFAVARAD